MHLAFLHSSVQLAVTLHIASIVELSPQHFRAAQAHALASRPEMALSRLDVYILLHTAPFVHQYYFASGRMFRGQ